MSEQLWYTWSSSGFGITSGFRIRAASKGLKDMQSARVQALMKYLPYHLPPGADPYMPPSEAPVCLAFLDTETDLGQVLVHKSYTGLDGVKRPGAFFSHLVTQLPTMHSPTTGAPEPFLAQDAIRRWRSDFWRDSEQGQNPGSLDLKEVTLAELHDGPVSLHDMGKVQDYLPFVIQAFLTLPNLGERQQLYIAAPSEIVALLIWGLTFCLPRTLKAMQTLTFSTFEPDVEKASTVIVGTCWLPPTKNARPGLSAQDLPDTCYLGHGLAINCFLTPPRQSRFEPEPLASNFAQFATDCLVKNNTQELLEILREAEQQDIQETNDFLLTYKLSQQLPSLADLKDILSTPKKARNLAKARVKQAVIETIETDTSSWRGWIKNMIGPLRQYAETHPHSEIVDTLTVFAKSIGDYILNAIRTDNPAAFSLWSDVLMTALLSTSEETVWAYLLQGLAVTSLTPTYQQWWRTQGQKIFINSSWLNQKRGGNIQNALSAFARKASQELQEAITLNDRITMPFWGEVLVTVAPPAERPFLWLDLLEALSTYMATPLFQQWWNTQGKAVLGDLPQAILAHKQTQKELARRFSTFAASMVLSLRMAIIRNDAAGMLQIADILAKIAPPSSEPNAWANLFKELAHEIFSLPLFQQWWNIQGKGALDMLQKSSEQRATLMPFTLQANHKLQEALQRNDAALAHFWSEVLLISAPPARTPMMWLPILHTMVTDTQRIVAYGQWWDAYGKMVANELQMLTARDAQTAAELARIGYDAGRALQSAIRPKNAGLVGFWEDVLLSIAPPSSAGQIWIDLLELFSAPLKTNAWDVYPLDIRLWLLQMWSMVPALTHHKLILKHWLLLPWHELRHLLERSIQHEWKKQAIKQLLLTQINAIAITELISLVQSYQPLFNEALQDLLQIPQTRQFAMDIFGRLIDGNYPERLSLASALLLSASGDATLTQAIIERVRLRLPAADMMSLLEDHSQQLLAQPTLSDGYLRLYFGSFTLEDLDRPGAKRMLDSLARINKAQISPEIYQSIQDWGELKDFLSTPLLERNRLRCLREALRHLQPNMRKVTARLLPLLVERISTEADLSRVIDCLGSVLFSAEKPVLASQSARPNAELHLLTELIATFAQRYQQPYPQPLVEVYVKLLLGDTQFLESPYREHSLDRCLVEVLKLNGDMLRNLHDRAAQWPSGLAPVWQTYFEWRLQNARRRFHEALQGGSITAIVETYDSILNADTTVPWAEHTAYFYAYSFIKAYQVSDDAEILRWYEEIKRSYSNIRFLPEHETRIIQISRRKEARPASSTRSGRLPSLKPTSAPVYNLAHAQSSAHIIVLTVNEQRITYTLFRKVYLVRPLYFWTSLAHLDGIGDDIKQLHTIPEQLMQQVQNDLIKDALIQEEIAKIERHNGPQLRELDTLTEQVLERVKEHAGKRYRLFFDQYQITDNDVKEALQIFTRYHLFTIYLQNRNMHITSWLEEQRTGARIGYNQQDSVVSEPIPDFSPKRGVWGIRRS